MLLIRNAELNGVPGVDVRCHDGRIIEIGSDLQDQGEQIIEAEGGVLLPGLHDHHIHLLALAAARRSVRCGPPEVNDADELRAVLRTAPGEDWIRGVGYHESVAGMLDRRRLDALRDDRPIRVQHRSGKMWFLNGAALARIGMPESNGQLFRQDALLREHTQAQFDLAEAVEDTSRLLARFGVTGITDATPGNDAATAALFRSLRLLQKVTLMGNEDLPTGTLKIMLDDYQLPGVDALRQRITRAHERARPVAIHCVTRTELVFALSALADCGAIGGDRIEHASVTDAACLQLLAGTGVTVVTQPNLISERGDQYLADVEPKDQAYLYRGKAFLRAGIALGGGTDAPYGSADPWIAMRAAVTRRTSGGQVIGPGEALSPEEALALFTTTPDTPGGAPRALAAGADADLCLLATDWSHARKRLVHDDVRATIVAARLTYRHASHGRQTAAR